MPSDGIAHADAVPSPSLRTAKLALMLAIGLAPPLAAVLATTRAASLAPDRASRTWGRAVGVGLARIAA